ncbi:MAG: DUF5074 domain-containing protein [Flavitalea sp.]
MRKNKLLLPVLILLTGLITITGCRKDDVSLPQPEITDNGMLNGKDSIVVGESITIHPKINNRTSTAYEWSVNGVAKSTDSVFVFQTDSAGDYKINYIAVNPTGRTSFEYAIHVWGKYEQGVILINEGWFGHDNGNVNFFRYGKDTVEQMIYKGANPGKELGVTSQHGAVFNNKLYIVSKQGPFVATDAKSLKETGRIENMPADGRAFAGVDATTGIISTSDGIYKVNLTNFTIGAKVAGVDGETGSLLVNGDYIFAQSQSEGAIILKKSDFSVVKKLADIGQGFAKTADGSIWATTENQLVKINPATLDTTKIALGFSMGSSWFAWNDGTLTAGNDAVYIAKTQPWGAGGDEIYKYVPGNTASLSAPWAKIPAGKEFYGSGARFNSARNELVVTAIQSGYGQNYKYNSLYFYDPSGTLKKTVSYEYFYFPALILFN